MSPPKPPAVRQPTKRKTRSVFTPGTVPVTASTPASTSTSASTTTVPSLVALTVAIPPDTSSSSTDTTAPLTSPALSTAASSSSSSSTTRKQPKSGVTNEEAYEKLCSGDYILEDPDKKWSCPAWKSFKLVVEDKTFKKVGVVQCQRCLKCLAHSSDSGPSSLAKHLRGACRVPDAAAKECVIVPKRMKDHLAAKLAEKCARDLSSISGAVGEGMANVVQAALDIGSACPGAQAADLMPCFNTVRRKLVDEADECRAKVVARMREAIADGRCAATTDM
ncbi:Transposable element Hobo transposase [Frankliniella fusca]|uniref:Transposable element Hobo transposase n=1 Tax=Frankliniella fusca TaxID=407009 RepID=A0AAE1HR20_9NEOP|nr:Transposable element Hobo transposase [Frankliniella fusca]